MLDLLHPIYKETAAYGHFGRRHFPWEKTDKAQLLRDAAGLSNLPSVLAGKPRAGLFYYYLTAVDRRSRGIRQKPLRQSHSS